MADTRTPDAPHPEALPVAEVIIEVNRDTGRVIARDVEIFSSPDGSVPGDLPQQVRWVVRTGLLADELVIIFGKPLDWSGPLSTDDPPLPHVESVFPMPLTLGRTCLSRASGPPDLEFPEGSDAVAWPYGIVVTRGRDTPLIAHPRVWVRRTT